MIIGLKQWRKTIPGVLVAVVGAILVVYFFDLDDDLSVAGAMPRGFPTPALGGITVADAINLAPAAVGIALIAFADTSVLSRTFATRAGVTVNGSQEMAAIGTANIPVWDGTRPGTRLPQCRNRFRHIPGGGCGQGSPCTHLASGLRPMNGDAPEFGC